MGNNQARGGDYFLRYDKYNKNQWNIHEAEKTNMLNKWVLFALYRSRIQRCNQI